MNNKKNISLLLLLLVSTALIGQTSDFGIWSSVGLEKKVGKWNFGFETELRTQNNSSEINRWSSGLEASYSLFKPLQIGSGYEFIYFNDTKYSDFQPRHRGYAFIQGKYKLGRFTFSLRERAQITKKDDSDRIKSNGEINTYKINPEWTWRNRIKASYNIPDFPITPAFSFESFYQLNNPDGNEFDKLRYMLSLSYNLKKQHQFEIYGLLDREINVTNPCNTYVIGVGYTFQFK